MRPMRAEAGDVERGKQLAETAGCISCHALPTVSQYKSPPLAEIRGLDSDRGCLSAERGKAPDLGLSKEAIEDLKAFIVTGVPSLSRKSPLEFAERQFSSQQCIACHQQDGEMDSWSRFQGEVAKWAPKKKTDHEGQPEPAQDRPSLTWAGEKLIPEWTRTLLAGELKTPARPWLRARMPVYPAHADELARGLAYGHGIPDLKQKAETADPELVEIGRTLVTKQLGFGCTDCHGVGEAAPIATASASNRQWRCLRRKG